jgi:hypothetical protein
MRVFGFGSRVSGLGFFVFRFSFSERRRIFPSPALFPGGEGVGGEGLRYGEPLLVRTSGIDVPRSANDVHAGDGGWQRSVACQSFGCPARQGSHPALLFPSFPHPLVGHVQSIRDGELPGHATVRTDQSAGFSRVHFSAKVFTPGRRRIPTVWRDGIRPAAGAGLPRQTPTAARLTHDSRLTTDDSV